MAFFVPLNLRMHMYYAILDIEFIQLSKKRNGVPGSPPLGIKSKVYQCIRKATILNYNDHLKVWDTRPCIEFEDLDWKEKKHFKWCQNRL